MSMTKRRKLKTVLTGFIWLISVHLDIASGRPISFPPSREADLISHTTCDLPLDSQYGLYIVDIPGFSDYAIEYRMKTEHGKPYQVLMLVAKQPSRPGEARCDAILAVNRVRMLHSKDTIAVQCTGKGGAHLNLGPVVAIGRSARPWRSNAFVATRAWRIDLQTQRFIPIDRKLLVCKPEALPN